jgi:hypothetical protein
MTVNKKFLGLTSANFLSSSRMSGGGFFQEEAILPTADRQTDRQTPITNMNNAAFSARETDSSGRCEVYQKERHHVSSLDLLPSYAREANRDVLRSGCCSGVVVLVLDEAEAAEAEEAAPPLDLSTIPSTYRRPLAVTASLLFDRPTSPQTPSLITGEDERSTSHQRCISSVREPANR